MKSDESGVVVAVSSHASHQLGKTNRERILLVAGLGVENDSHAGRTVQHRSRVARDPSQPNLRQVHLVHQELYDELRANDFRMSPGEMGENITTRGLALLALPRSSRLLIGSGAIVEITGLRNPCKQLNDFRAGLMDAVLARDEQGQLVRKAGVMGVVVEGGEVRPGDPIEIELPPEPHHSLEPV